MLDAGPEANVAQLVRNQQAEDVFLELLATYKTTGRHISTSTGHNYAPAKFAREERGRVVGRVALEGAMNRLFNADRIHLMRVRSTKPTIEEPGGCLMTLQTPFRRLRRGYKRGCSTPFTRPEVFRRTTHTPPKPPRRWTRPYGPFGWPRGAPAFLWLLWGGWIVTDHQLTGLWPRLMRAPTAAKYVAASVSYTTSLGRTSLTMRLSSNHSGVGSTTSRALADANTAFLPARHRRWMLSRRSSSTFCPRAIAAKRRCISSRSSSAPK